MTLPLTTQVLRDAIAARIFPGAIVEVGNEDGPLAVITVGRLQYEDNAPAVTADTVYDLASLTKVLCTTTLAAALVEQGTIGPVDLVSRWSASWRGQDRDGVTLRHLLDHSSGLPAHRPYYETLTGEAAFEAAIGAEPLVYAPGSESRYSDPGFILLGIVLARAGGAALDVLFDRWRDTHIGTAFPLQFRPPDAWLPRIAPTEMDAWRGRLLRGEVHDENAAALGGVAGHAGLFGTAASVGAVARWWMRAARTSLIYEGFRQPSGVPGSSRALGWDTMRPTSSCGPRMSPSAVGHTGFTGTSLWIDPVLHRYVVLLSNRVHPTRAGDAMTTLRQSVHGAVTDDLLRS
ncbi:MAG: beta-lactamase family protein [Acidobacteria bacterium]|nr:beta-lactamase family protein [Acidobacteriota bacterium]